MTFISRCFSFGAIFFLSLVAVLSSTQVARSEADFEFAAKGLTLRNARGRTLVGMTRDSSKTWSVHLSRSGEAQFSFSTGKTATARWYVDSKNILCFKGLIKEDPKKEICKLTTPRGRGMDWMTVELYQKNGKKYYRKATKGERRGSSQIVYSYEGKRYVSKSSYRSDLRKWAGKVVVGRTLKDREAWVAFFKKYGQVDFAFGSGRRYKGRYTATKGQICMTFPGKPSLNGCRKPTIRKGKIMWASSKDGSYISEVVFLTTASKTAKSNGTSSSSSKKPVEYASEVKRFGDSYLEVPFGHLSNGKFHVQIGMLDKVIRIIETARGKQVAGLKRKNMIIGADLFGTRLAWLESGRKVYVWDLSNPNKLDITSIEVPGLKVSSVRIDSSGTLLALGKSKSNEVYLWDIDQGDLRQVVTVGDAEKVRPVAFTIGSPHLVMQLDDTRYRTLNYETGDYTEISTQLGMKYSSFTLASDRQQAVLVESNPDKKKGYLSTYKFNGSQWNFQARASVLTGQPNAASISPDGKEVLFSIAKRGIYSYTMPTLKNRAKVTGKLSGAVWHFGQKGDFLVSSLSRKGTTLMARNNTNKQRYKLSYGANAFPLADRITEETIRVNKEIAEEEAAYAAVLKDAKEFYKNGRCDEYAAISSELKKSDRQKVSCARARTLRAKTAEFDRAIERLDCATAADIDQKYRVGINNELTACFDRAQKRDDLLAFNLAKKNGDCAKLAEVETRLGREGEASNCRLERAMESGSPRKMFLEAVKFDTSGDFQNAKALYEAIMERFPEDDVALQAATRVVTLTDQLRANKEAARQARETQSALAAAKREAEAARKEAAAAERAAKREKEKRERDLKIKKKKEERLARIKRKLADINAKYGLHSGYATVSSKVSGRERYYDISGHFRITPVVQSPSTAREFCKVKIDSSGYPRHSKINLPNNKYFTPSKGKSAFIVDLAANVSGAKFGRTLHGTHLFQERSENKVAFTTFANGKFIEITWEIPVRKLHQSGSHYKSGSRTTVMQLFSNIEPAFDDMKSLIATCYLARND